MPNHEYRVIEHSEREALHGKEFQGQLEVTRPDGSKEIKRYFERTVELQDSSIRVSCHIIPRIGPVTIVKSIRMGSIERDLRKNHVQVTMILPDGAVYRAPEAEITVPLTSPLKDKSPQEAMDYTREYLTNLFASTGQPATPEEAVEAIEHFNKGRWGLEPKN